MSAVDYYDVQSMIRDARSELRGEIDRAIREAKETLRDELRELQHEIDSLTTTLHSRTDHLA